jgi:hypothetical protein
MSERYQVEEPKPGEWVIRDTLTGREVDWPTARQHGLTQSMARALVASMNEIERKREGGVWRQLKRQ